MGEKRREGKGKGGKKEYGTMGTKLTFDSPVSPQYLKLCLAHSWCLVNIFE